MLEYMKIASEHNAKIRAKPDTVILDRQKVLSMGWYTEIITSEARKILPRPEAGSYERMGPIVTAIITQNKMLLDSYGLKNTKYWRLSY